VREGLLSGPDLDLEPILARRQRTAPVLVVRAVGVIGTIEIQQIPSRAKRLGFDVPAGTVGLVPAAAITEGDEEAVALLVREQFRVAIADAEAQPSGAHELAGAPVARFDRFDNLGRLGIESDLEAVGRVLGKVAQAGEGVPVLDNSSFSRLSVATSMYPR